MLLYIDNSVLNRPFDDQRQPRIWLETLSFSLVLSLVENGDATLIHSPVHDLENGRNPFPIRRKWVRKCLRLAAQNIGLTIGVRTRAAALEQHGFKAIDSLHLACAEAAHVTNFLTCDDRLIRRYSGRMVIQGPMTFITSLR
jgi:hypothetical protein